jgi:tetratricopeptide (TPR) repeat protein
MSLTQGNRCNGATLEHGLWDCKYEQSAMKRESDASNPGKQPRSAGRAPLWVRISVAILSPIIFLLLVELGLSFLGYGLPKDFFVRWTSGDHTIHVANKFYCDHFVPSELSRAPEPSIISVKGAGQFRVFVLGGSAANGDPVPAFGFCRQLEVLLNEHSNGIAFEVVNVAVTSMNSFVARRIAQDCAAYKPDAFVVFMGNNEVIGPYGPPTLPAPLYARRGLINACITAQKDSRLGQLLKSGLSAVRSAGKPSKKWMGMEAFLESQVPYDDEKLDHCYRHFSENISDIVDAAHKANARTILFTVPTNLRSCAPFGSQHRGGLTQEQRAEWDAHFRKARELERSGNYSASLAEYEQAAKIDDSYAELSFCMGTCLAALGKSVEAREHYGQARDYDTLRFRADSRINDTIRQASRDLSAQGAALLDLEACLSDRALPAVTGDDFFVDHVHLNFVGNFQAAYATMKLMCDQMPAAQLKMPERSEEELLKLCKQRLLYDHNERYKLAMIMYRRKTLPPFTDQLDHEEELDRLRQALFGLRRRAKDHADTELMFTRALEHARLDSYLNRRYGEFLISQGEFSKAMRLFQTVLRTRPYDREIRSAFARALAQGNSQAEAIKVLSSAEMPYGHTRQEALLMLGTHYLRNGRIAQAGKVFQELHAIDPDNIDVLINMASAASHRKGYAAMRGYLEQVLALAPDTVEAMINMGNYYVKTQQSESAHGWFLKAVDADPYNPMAHIGLGLQSIRLGQLQKGLEHLKKAVHLKPDFIEGYQVLEKVYRELGQADKAQRYAELCTLFQP